MVRELNTRLYISCTHTQPDAITCVIRSIQPTKHGTECTVKECSMHMLDGDTTSTLPLLQCWEIKM